MEREVAFEILSDFAAKYALVKFINNGKVRIYWSWDKSLPVSLIITANNVVTKVFLKHERRGKKIKSIEAAEN